MKTILERKSLPAIEISYLSLERMIGGFSFFSMKGFLGTGATFGADLNLVVQIIMGVALALGAILARQKRYRAHGICQTTVLLLNLLMIGLVMWPSFQQQVKPALSKVLHKWYYEAAAIHAVLGITAELLGLYIALVAGTNVLPQRLRFKHWKWWMRTELVLWAIVLLSGVGTYCAWYVAPFR
jgi:fumarate reductase subunit D